MKIVLDTNIIFSDFHLTGAKIRNLCESVKSTGDIVYIPEIVIDESINKYRENLQKHKLNIDKGISDFNRLTENDAKNPITDDIVKTELDKFSKHFKKQIIELGIEIIPYPSISHKELVKRDLSRKRPFQESGKGYRDALIWESIKNICEESYESLSIPEIIFINKNSRDFCEKEYTLHSDLAEDLKNNDINENAVKIIEDIDKFIVEHIKLKQKIRTDIIEKLNKDKQYNDIYLNVEIENRLEKFLLYREFDYEDNPFRQEFENPSITGINEPIFEVKEVRQISDKETLIEIDAEVECEFYFYIFKGDFWAMDDEDMPYIWDNDWNKHYMAASESTMIYLKVSLIVDNIFSEVLSDEIEIISK